MRTKSYLSRRQDAYRKKRMKAQPAQARAPIPTGRGQQRAKPMGTMFALAANYGPFCHICGLFCDFRSTAKPTRITATRDHLVPRSHGGKGNGNYRIAHAYCNSKRGTLEVTEEMGAKFRRWLNANVGEAVIAEAATWFNAHVRPILPSRDKTPNAIEEYRQEALDDLARREDLFLRCCQGGLANGR